MTIDLPYASFVYPPKARLAIKWPCSRPQAGCQRCTQRFTTGSSSLTGDLSLRTGRISNHAQDALITTRPGTRYSRSLVLPPIDKIGNALRNTDNYSPGSSVELSLFQHFEPTFFVEPMFLNDTCNSSTIITYRRVPICVRFPSERVTYK